VKNILIRCDASKNIGLGHITRCLVLAKGFQKEGHRIYFAMKNYQLGIEKVKKEKFPIILFDEKLNYNNWILKIIDENDVNIFIGDVRDELLVKTIKNLKKKEILTVAIDEPSEYAKECDMCFYPPHAKIDEKLYKGEVYQGFEYVILRDEFYKHYENKVHDTPNIMVMMGGTDAYNLTYKIVKQLIDLKQKMNIKVIINKNHPDYDKIKNIDEKISIYFDIQNMAKFLQKIDFGIISFGVSAYELLLMQIPSIHICLNEEHWSASTMFEKLGYAKKYSKDRLYIKASDLKITYNISEHFSHGKVVEAILD